MTPRDTRSIPELLQLLSTLRGARLTRLLDELADDDRAGVRSAVESARSRESARRREAARIKRLYQLERTLAEQGYLVVAGVDEVGRGALAGPLTAGACVLPAEPRIEGLNDSKALTPQRREELAAVIREVAVCWSVGHVQADELDALGMTAALRRAMGRALGGLELEPDHVVVDGHPVGIAPTETSVIKGDAQVAAIAAASILAKVERDGIMISLSSEHPEYGFEINKGYGTPEHLSAIARTGLSPVHRVSFSIGGGTGTLF